MAYACNPTNLGGQTGQITRGQELKTNLFNTPAPRHPRQLSQHVGASSCLLDSMPGHPLSTLRVKWADHLRSKVQDQPGQHGETSVLKKQKLAESVIICNIWAQKLTPVIPTLWRSEAEQPQKSTSLAAKPLWTPLDIKDILETTAQNDNHSLLRRRDELPRTQKSHFSNAQWMLLSWS
ncbi:hypothetical protein AAY473_031952 [Plecturocebus cupreus]